MYIISLTFLIKGLETSTNSIPAIYAWSKALKERAKLDDNIQLMSFTQRLEESVIEAVNEGFFTKDLACLVYETQKYIF